MFPLNFPLLQPCRIVTRLFFLILGPCEHGSVRVVNSQGISSRLGNVELCINGRWKTVCANSWDNRDASVICKQIRYSPHGNLSSV